MNNSPQKSKAKQEIIAQIADLSKLLGMIPSDDTIKVNEPVTQNSMELSKWFDDTRQSFLKLSVLLDKALDLKLS
jgi:hypothetical protein